MLSRVNTHAIVVSAILSDWFEVVSGRSWHAGGGLRGYLLLPEQ
jgi:hypothetical protein